MSYSNPCLIGIALVIKKKTEPHLVFHYPPKPGEDNSYFKSLFKSDSIDTTSSSSDDESDAEEGGLGDSQAKDAENKDSPPDLDEAGSASPQKGPALQQGTKRLLWNDVFGYNSGVLAKAWCPAKGCYKRFEMSLGNNVILGRPVYAKDDGAWKRKRVAARRSSDMTSPTAEKAASGIRTISETLGQVNEVSVDASNLNSAETEDSGVATVEEKKGRAQPEEVMGNPDSSKTKNAEIGTKDTLVMFNVVFVLRPPPLEYHARVKDMYEHVVKKFTKALKWEQARSSYVAKESALISSTANRVINANKANPPLATLYHDIISQSSLAKAIATLYNNISNSKIAHLNLTSSMSLSLQIPIPTSISVLPTPLEPQMPGLWLTTATSLPADDDVQLTSSQISSHFTLLLLYDLHTILADISAAGSSVSGPLAHCLRVSKSTKSFLQISQSSGIALSEIQFFASHMIYWRRARAIPPLRQSDIYIMSPNADMRDLSSATSRFAKAFPIMPPLPRILGMLSTSPKPYSALIPNKDRKEMFMDILAWLLRGGWVTQLRTFAWIRVPAQLKAAVDEEKAEKGVTHELNGLKVDDKSEKDAGLVVPDLRTSSPTSSTHTAMPADDLQATASAVLIPNPRYASTLPSHYLSAIATRIGEIQGSESKAAWETCRKYFDGKHAIETIAVREGWKRKRVTELFAGWEALGFLAKTRHW